MRNRSPTRGAELVETARDDVSRDECATRIEARRRRREIAKLSEHFGVRVFENARNGRLGNGRRRRASVCGCQLALITRADHERSITSLKPIGELFLVPLARVCQKSESGAATEIGEISARAASQNRHD